MGRPVATPLALALALALAAAACGDERVVAVGADSSSQLDGAGPAMSDAGDGGAELATDSASMSDSLSTLEPGPDDVVSAVDEGPDGAAAAEDTASVSAADVSAADMTVFEVQGPTDPDEALPLKSGEADYYDETAPAVAPGPEGTTAPEQARAFGPGPRWRLEWRDEFDGPQPWEDPECYSRVAQCIPRVSWGTRDCPPEAAAQLADLNKCNWAVYDFYNYMNGAEEDGKNINAFDWSEVRVSEGQLILGARSVGSSHEDCGRWYADPAYGEAGSFTVDCPILSGGLESRTHDNPWNGTDYGQGDLRGFDQAFGRFEVHAKLSHGPGTWPAFWMMPAAGAGEGWPGDGEIDVMESWSHNAHDSVGTFHDADPATGTHIWDGHHWSAKQRKVYPQSDRKRTFYEDWHTWAVEWDDQELRFYVDKWLIGSTWTGKTVTRKHKDYQAGVPDYPFYWLLNLSIADGLGNWFENLWGDYRPDLDDFDPQELRIDWVRVYSACDSPEDYCPWGGSWDGERCDLGVAPSGPVWTVGGQVRTDAGVLYELPDIARPRIIGGHIVTRGACVETTSQERCDAPCAGVGAFDGYGCVVGVAPNSLKADLDGGAFYYRKTWIGGLFSDPDCLPEHPLVDGKGCLYGQVPAGREAFVTNEGDYGKFYLEPVCNPTKNLPNCVHPCPAGGHFDGVACRLRFAPSGTDPFVWGDKLYYKAMTDDPATACPRGGSWDGANCLLGPAPAPGAFDQEGAFYLPTACEAVPWAEATGR